MRKVLAFAVLLAMPACGGGSSSPTPVTVATTTTTTTLPPTLWHIEGSGNTVFDMPRTVARVRIRGVWSGRGTSNFIVHIGNNFTVNEILRNMPNLTYEGIHLTGGGGVTEIVNSSEIAWTFDEVR